MFWRQFIAYSRNLKGNVFVFKLGVSLISLSLGRLVLEINSQVLNYFFLQLCEAESFFVTYGISFFGVNFFLGKVDFSCIS